MPCFKGLAVSIHAPEGPLPEYSIQKQSKYSRITSYIPVPPAKVPPDSLTNKPEQSTFAISITLLTPGLAVPYSAPKATPDDPYPRPKLVGGLSAQGSERGQYSSTVGPYLPLTTSPNETIAAYIYFDGRQKEEVATLLRRGEETWVNSRWVSVPDSEGGGLAEREFLFREVGLERWLNGLDLDGKDAAAKIERRRLRMEKRRRRRKGIKDEEEADMELDEGKKAEVKTEPQSPGSKMSDDEDLAFSSDSDSDEEPPPPEAAGQIKVALFRVLASGEIKRGEYSPQFDAHDDDDESEGGRAERNGNPDGESGEADIDHTTSFAKPKTLDPKSISTQTVTGIDGPEKPYATFTFLYRGERQLQKMGILPSPEPAPTTATTSNSKRRSVQTDFSKLGPLKAGGTVGFSGFRDSATSQSPTKKIGKKGKKSVDSANDADSEDDSAGETEEKSKVDDLEVDSKEEGRLLDPEDARRGRELAEGVRQIKLKRVHSAEPLQDSAPRKSPSSIQTPTGETPPPSHAETHGYPSSDVAHDPTRTPPSSAFSLPPTSANNPREPDESVVGSPLKKQRPSIPGFEDEHAEAMRARFGMGGAEIFGGKLGEDEEM